MSLNTIRVFVCPLLYVGLSDQFLMNHVSGLTHQQAECLAVSLGVKQSQLDSLRSLYPADPQLFAYHAIRKWRDSCELAEDKAREELAMAVLSLPKRQPINNGLKNGTVAVPVITMATGSDSFLYHDFTSILLLTFLYVCSLPRWSECS